MSTLMRWTPLNRDLLGLGSDVNRLLDGVLAGTGLAARGVFTPAVDIEENTEGFVLSADLPGIAPKDVKVSLSGDTLTIRGERKTERKDKHMHRIERTVGSFERSFTLAVPVRADRIQATYRDGVLEVHVPKADEAKVREIEVQVGS